MENKKRVFVELHMLQNFAPANLNRDDTGAPKDCEFGGYRRARISSQCLKRAIRMTFREQGLLPSENLSERTALLLNELVDRLKNKGRDDEGARRVAETAIRSVGLGLSDGKTQYLLFLGRGEIAALADKCDRHWDELRKVLSPSSGEAPSERDSRKKKKESKSTIPEEVARSVKDVLDGGKAADLALFGRMLADMPGKNIDAACQVAHAISTNRISMEFDWYTAVDDLQPEEASGAGMMGTVEYNSACFYRYANLDVGQLIENLGGDRELALKTVEAFLRASVAAVPTGKQNSMAAQNPPSLVFGVVRSSGLWSLANAFEKPISPVQGGLVQNSINALDGYWGQLLKMYAEASILGKWCATLGDGELSNLQSAKVRNVSTLIENVVGEVRKQISEG